MLFNNQTFENREQAGILLARDLMAQIKSVDLVYAIPRGGMIVGAPIARAYHCPIVPVFVAKIRHPDYPEYAIGAMDEAGAIDLSPRIDADIPEEQLRHSIHDAGTKIWSQRRIYQKLLPKVEPKGKIVLLVDDGLATGETCRAALKFLKRMEPARLILAVPCASTSGAELVRGLADQFFSVVPPDDAFVSVGQYYEDFSQTTDEQAVRALEEGNSVEALNRASRSGQ